MHHRDGNYIVVGVSKELLAHYIHASEAFSLSSMSS